MLEQQIVEETTALWPLLTPTERETVQGVIEGFRSIDSDASRRLLLRFLKQARLDPRRIGYHPDLRPCGCLDGFRTIRDDGHHLTVARCSICSPTFDVSTFPASPYT